MLERINKEIKRRTRVATLFPNEPSALRLVTAVEQAGARFELPRASGERVLGRQACDEVRRMMALGAEHGTGRAVARAERNPEFAWLGTKTGTSEKVLSEVCLHAELDHVTSVHADGAPCPSACRGALAGLRSYHRRSRPCYTSSMAAVGRLAGDEREVLVLVVVDDPRGKAKFGADVAGPTAIALLRRAFDLPAEPDALAVALPAPGDEWFNARDLPWAEVASR